LLSLPFFFLRLSIGIRAKASLRKLFKCLDFWQLWNECSKQLPKNICLSLKVPMDWRLGWWGVLEWFGSVQKWTMYPGLITSFGKQKGEEPEPSAPIELIWLWAGSFNAIFSIKKAFVCQCCLHLMRVLSKTL